MKSSRLPRLSPGFDKVTTTRLWLLAAVCSFVPLFLSACGQPGTQSDASKSVQTGKPSVDKDRLSYDEEKSLYGKEIAAMAAELDRGFEDGWICGRNTRLHKSGYKKVKPEIKAAFALAYQEMVNQSKQNLAMDIDSYIPYSKRFKFALDWWRHSEAKDAFEKESVKKKIVWVHESLLDGSELFWRVFEIQHPGQVNSVAVMAHDLEQDMVYNYMEREGEPGSFSKLYKKWSAYLENSG